MSAPVCHVPGTPQPINPPTDTQQSIPVARRGRNTDDTLDSILATLNALRNALLRLQGQFNNTPASKGGGLKLPQEQKRVQWSEKTRTTEKVKVYQNNDKNSPNWVEVEQINSLIMIDKNTGQTWEWKRKP